MKIGTPTISASGNKFTFGNTGHEAIVAHQSYKTDFKTPNHSPFSVSFASTTLITRTTEKAEKDSKPKAELVRLREIRKNVTPEAYRAFGDIETLLETKPPLDIKEHYFFLKWSLQGLERGSYHPEAEHYVEKLKIRISGRLDTLKTKQ